MKLHRPLLVSSFAFLPALASFGCATSSGNNGGGSSSGGSGQGAFGGFGGGGSGGSITQGGSGGSITQGGSGGSITQGGSGGSITQGGSGNAGSGGTIGSTGGGTSTGAQPNTAPGFMNLAPPMGDPLPDTGDTVTPAPPTGWNWYNIDGSMCRDGSPSGIYVHKGTASKLVIYLEGGGACTDDHFCAFNPNSVNQVLAGDGSTVLGTVAGTGAGRQQPGVYSDASHTAAPAGLFDTSNAANPFKDWSQVYVPYCTGDVHFGTAKNVMIPNISTPQQFVGYDDMKLYIGRIVPTFKNTVNQVVITGASAGAFGAALNFSMVQDAFGSVPVIALDDSGPPFDDSYMPACLQTNWREVWGFANSLPKDCTECQQADGGGGDLVHLADFLLRKHPNARIGILSSVQDEVIRLFYSMGLDNCMNYAEADPVPLFLAESDPTQFFSAATYTAGLNALRTTYVPTGKLSTYYMSGQLHQHIFRPEFFTSTAGSITEAQWAQDFIDGKIEQIGP